MLSATNACVPADPGTTNWFGWLGILEGTAAKRNWPSGSLMAPLSRLKDNNVFCVRFVPVIVSYHVPSPQFSSHFLHFLRRWGGCEWKVAALPSIYGWSARVARNPRGWAGHGWVEAYANPQACFFPDNKHSLGDVRLLISGFIHLDAPVCTYIDKYIYIYIYKYTHICYVYIYMSVYICIYIYICSSFD